MEGLGFCVSSEVRFILKAYLLVLDFIGQANRKHNFEDKFAQMNIIWKLDRPIPAEYLKKTNKLVVG